MRFSATALALGLCSVVAMGAVVRIPVKGQIHSQNSVGACVLADGGEPVPPWSSGSVLLADGGEPVPPWSSGSVLLADGGEPVPPWSSGSVLLADGNPVVD